MEQNATPARLPRWGMLLTTLLVLGGLCALQWWTGHRAEIYAQRAAEAAEQGDWAQAETQAKEAQAAGVTDALDKLTYDRASALLAAGEYEAARNLFLELGSYEDAARQAMACTYGQAAALEAAEAYEAARDAYLSVAGYEDALDRADRCRYALAEKALAAGDREAAFRGFLDLGVFEDAMERAQELAKEITGEADEKLAMQAAQGYTPEVLSLQEQLSLAREAVQNQRLAAGQGHALVLTGDGTVLAAGENGAGQCDTGAWTGVVAVAAGYAHSLGLTVDGRVLAVGDNSQGQCNTGDWNDVVRIVCGPWDSYGLTADGRWYHCGFRDLSAQAGWTGLTAIAPGDGVLFALRENGALLSSLADQSQPWQDLCAVAAAGYAPVGLTRDGTVLSARLDLSAWKDVIALESSTTLLAGLRADGTLLLEPLLPVDPALLNALRSETDVVGFALAGTWAILLHRDGTLTAPGATFDVRAFNH